MATNKPITDLTIYSPDQYHILARPEELVPRPQIDADLVVVRIDPNPESGHVHVMEAGLPAVPEKGWPARPAKLMFAKSAVDHIAAQVGISVRVEVQKDGPACWIGKAIAARRGLDGAWEYRSAESEFDAPLRAELDAMDAEKRIERWKATPPRNRKGREPAPVDVRHRTLEYRKRGRAMADTGARLRVIRAFLGLKNTYTDAECQRKFVFARRQIKMSAPAHIAGSNPFVGFSGEQLAAMALPAPADDDMETIEAEAEDLAADDEGDAQPAAADTEDEYQGASEAFDADADLPLFGNAAAAATAADHDAPVDPIGDAALDLGMSPAPDRRKPKQFRLCQIYARLSEKQRTQLKPNLPADWSEGAAKPIVEVFEPWLREKGITI